MYISKRPLPFLLFFNRQSKSLFCLSSSPSPLSLTKNTHSFITKMLSFRSVLFAAAAFATVVSAVPTPDVDSSLVQRTPLLEILDGLPIVGGLLGGPGLNVEGNTPAKRGRPSCGELINKCHGDIAVIAVKIC